MTYHIEHTTTYTYDDRVSICHNLAHLLPRQAPRHMWLNNQLHITPSPATRSEHHDYFGNRVTFFAIQEPHRKLSVTARGDVELTTPDWFKRPAPMTPWEDVRDLVATDRRPDRLAAYQYVFDSPFIARQAALYDYAAQTFTPGRPLFDATIELCGRIYKDFTYDPKATTIATPLADVMKHRRGVCQDFAHLMVGCLRSFGVPARYVSGYLLTSPPPGRARLVGCDASHAWVSAWIPEFGWVDVDPTNNIVISDKHITLAWGRDYSDISPLRGVILGGGRHTVSVAVDVRPIA
jgi:transglutaminase-like putative cysteine protease